MTFDLNAALSRVRERVKAQDPGPNGRPKALILTHDNPDPDSLAAAMGLERLLIREGIAPVIGTGGIIGRAQNRAMVRELGLVLTPFESVELDTFPLVALVDTQPGTGNNSLPPSRLPDIVIDHHPPRPLSRQVPWCDIRPDYGASSTIVWTYLQEAKIDWDPILATAFLYAIKTETRDLGRDAGPLERQAYLELSALSDHAKLYAITNPKLGREHFVALDRACRMAICWGELIAVNLGSLPYPDLVAEIADLMLAYDKASWCVCVGEHEGSVYLSIRSDVEDAHAGELIRRVVGSKGAAGGHGLSAGGRLHGTVREDAELKQIYDELVARLVAELRITQPPTPLL
ncbi:MAG: DHH family phosphoesterase [Myxococcales bacterium]|nr:DHH family phosphoesterase [Myxococcota bacterium]MDW8283090.1 DHH family phosphoesterase [Myxococcales bacterium]